MTRYQVDTGNGIMYRLDMRTSILIASLALAAGSATFATEPVSSDQQKGNAPVSSADDTTIKCRSISVTGSLARKERTCKTVAEWRRLRERGSDVAREIVDYSRTRPGGQ